MSGAPVTKADAPALVRRSERSKAAAAPHMTLQTMCGSVMAVFQARDIRSWPFFCAAFLCVRRPVWLGSCYRAEGGAIPGASFAG